MKKKLILIGGGGHSKTVLDAVDRNEFEVAGILDTPDKIGSTVCGVPVIGTDEDIASLGEKGITHAVISIGHMGNWKLRDKLFNLIIAAGIEPAVIIHNNAVISPFAKIGRGTVVLANAVVNSSTVIDENCIINTAAVVEHDCVIGKNVHIAPKAVVAGGTSIGDNTFIGLNSAVINGLSIGKNCIIGAGSVVIGDIADNCKAFGVPARLH
jgi:sugar O-acyltransferase (sialic acid O-acetyltransferase NeuD family)